MPLADIAEGDVRELALECANERDDAMRQFVSLRPEAHSDCFNARKPMVQYQTACSKTRVSHSGSSTITAWPDVVFSNAVQDLSALHSANALSRAA